MKVRIDMSNIAQLLTALFVMAIYILIGGTLLVATLAIGFRVCRGLGIV
jgi:hypothetical protein